MVSVRTLARYCAGHLLNAAGIPGVLVDGEYRAEICRADIRVKVGPLFTVVSVNGVDVYFHRLTGEIDGVGVTPESDSRPGAFRGSGHSVEPPAPATPPVHRQTA